MTTTSHDEMTIGCEQAAIDTRQQSIQDVEKQSGRMVRPRMPPESRATCREVGARRLAKRTLDLDTFALHLTSFARFLCLQHTCTLLSLFCFILSIAPAFCCFPFLFTHFAPKISTFARVFFQNTHNVLLPRLARFNWPQPLITPPTHTANVFARPPAQITS
jgi:hypothetical protein